MALREDLLPVFDNARQLVQDFGLRQSRVWVRRGVFSSGEIHLGDLTNNDVELLPRPKVEQQDTVTLKVTRITPPYPGGGYDTADLLPPQEAGVDRMCVVQVGTDGPKVAYRIVDIDERKNFGITLMLERIPGEQPDEYDHDE